MNRYVKSLLNRFCYSELHDLFVRTSNPIKEITESYSPYHILSSLKIKLDDEVILHIGDGSKCTTGALFTFLTKSYNVSVDPLVNEKVLQDWLKKYNVERFYYIKDFFQLVGVARNPDIIICVHSHVNLEEVDRKFPIWRYLYSSPCCQWENQTFSTDYMLKHKIKTIMAGTDKNILSDKNKIFLYKKD